MSRVPAGCWVGRDAFFHSSIQQTQMEPGTVLGTGNIKLTLTLNLPSLAVSEAEL